MKLHGLDPTQYDELAKLLHASLDGWHRTRLSVDRFGSEWEPFRLTVDVYETLDHGCCVVAVDDAGALMGSAFFHPSETHIGVGVVTVHPAAFGRGVRRALMEEVIGAADGKPLRLVSSAMNLDSFSLYTPGFGRRFRGLRKDAPPVAPVGPPHRLPAPHGGGLSRPQG